MDLDPGATQGRRENKVESLGRDAKVPKYRHLLTKRAKDVVLYGVDGIGLICSFRQIAQKISSKRQMIALKTAHLLHETAEVLRVWT